MLIVDTHDLEMNPIHLPALIKREKALSKVKLACIVDRVDSSRVQQLLDAGYAALLDTPIDKSQLFAAIKCHEEQSASNSNVVSLARFRQRSGQQPKRRILLADQHTADRKRIAALLQSAGHRVKTVENGEQALDALERQRFDVALINLQLPIMSGTQVIKLHRFTTPHPQWASFIVMTDQTTPATLRLCRELQVRACLFKPVPTDSLLDMINAAPAVSPPVPATIRQLAKSDGQVPETRFLHADLLDIKVLQMLDQLDGESGFAPDLIAIFKRDSVAILEGMEDAMECMDSKRFIDLSSILMDNAGQLGAFALYETCLTLKQISQRELNSTLSTKFRRLDELVARTNQAFERYLEQREEQQSDRS
jgi:two-component system sensor histidine kinase RpfC